MIRASDAIAAARALIGTPYAELDCINLIKKIIRTAPGGSPKYTTASTVSLWASYDASPKYRDLTERWENLIGVRAGEIVFKGKPLGFSHEPHHVGIATGEGTVIHSSSVYGKVVETPLTTKEGWTLRARHRYIEAGEGGENVSAEKQYDAMVKTPQGGPLNLRSGPGKSYPAVAKIENGERVEVITEYETGWAFIRYKNRAGYVSAEYLDRTQETAKRQGLNALDPAEGRTIDGFQSSLPMAETQEARILEWYVHVPCKNKEQAEALASLIPGAVAVVIGGDD